MPPDTKKIKEEEGGNLRINKGISLMLQPSRRDLLQQQFKQTQIKQERKMLDVTLTFTALFSVLFLLVGGIIGWLYQQHVQQQQMSYFPVHPEMFDEHGNLVPDEIISFRFENADLTHDEEELEED